MIMNLSEAPDRELRMADLAVPTGLSPSRTTRLVDGLRRRGWSRSGLVPPTGAATSPS